MILFFIFFFKQKTAYGVRISDGSSDVCSSDRGSAMSPYSEKFSCKNDDHGQCIHPEKAYEDAAEGRASRSDPAVTRDKILLKANQRGTARRGRSDADAYGDYRDSVYRELQGLIEAPEAPMLRPAQAVRTLILPYADRNRPDRLYMPRFVYSVLERSEEHTSELQSLMRSSNALFC